MRILTSTALGAAVVLSGFGAITGAQAPPATDVFLAPLSSAGGTITIGPPVNISSSPGYDNQPSFTPDGGAILFTSDRSRVVSAPVEGVPPPRPQTDIYRYDIASKRVTQVTDTILSEYSPTVTPDGQGISVIRVESDGTQRLWRFTIDGKSPAVVLENVKPVGYHAWIDEHALALFILGERPKPATLQVADTRTGRAQVMAEDIGQSVQRIPAGGISFVQRDRPAGADASAPGVWMVKRLLNGEVEPLVAVVPGATSPQLAWTPDGLLLMAHEGTLFGWRAGDAAWKPVADLKALSLTNVTRLAVSPGGDRLALVAVPSR